MVCKFKNCIYIIYGDFRLIISLKKELHGKFPGIKSTSLAFQLLHILLSLYFQPECTWIQHLSTYPFTIGCIEPSFKLLQLYDKHPTTQSSFPSSSLSTFTIIQPVCNVFPPINFFIQCHWCIYSTKPKAIHIKLDDEVHTALCL